MLGQGTFFPSLAEPTWAPHVPSPSPSSSRLGDCAGAGYSPVGLGHLCKAREPSPALLPVDAFLRRRTAAGQPHAALPLR